MRIKIFILIGFLYFMEACVGRINEVTWVCDTTSKVKSCSDKAPIDSNQIYFPVKAFYDPAFFPGSDTAVVRWYSKELFNLNEYVIFSDTSTYDIYRFTYLPCWDNPFVVRIEKRDECYFVFWKLLVRGDETRKANLAINKVEVISRTDWEVFIAYLNKADFWNMKTTDNKEGKDGAQWILEGKTGDRYHVVDRWSPDKKSSFYVVCKLLTDFTDLSFNR